MKISNSKKELARIISENGGWRDGAGYLAMDTSGMVCGYLSAPKWSSSLREWTGSACFRIFISTTLAPNHQRTILSRAEYFHLYPAPDADGWIEWKGGECPVEPSTKIGVCYRNGGEFHSIITAASQRWSNNGWPADIIAYRLHKPEVKPEFCESVTRSIPEPESHEKLSPEAIEDAKFALMSESIEESKRKPTIEQLAQDYRNAKGYADRLQKEAGEAAAKAEEFAVEIRKKLLELQELIGIPNPEKEHELEITDWRDLMVGDEVECTKYATAYRFGVVCRIDESSEEQPIMVNHGDGKGTSWPSSWKFIRRP